MEIKEATEILESRIAVIKNNYPEIADYRQALELGAKALEKQIPKKPDYEGTAWIARAKQYVINGYALVAIMSMNLISTTLITVRTADNI